MSVAAPKRMKDWVGRKVRLLRPLETRGGFRFEAGEVLLVVSTWRGRLDLWDPASSEIYAEGRRSISHVDRWLVEPVE